MNERPGRWLSTREAARRLGVKPETLYAYVSRGLLPSHRDGRRSLFHVDDVERLAGGGRVRDHTGEELVVRSAITEIADGRLRYRGHDAAALAGSRRFEEVAELLWGGHLASEGPWRADEAALRAARAAQEGLPSHTPALDRLRVVCGVVAAMDSSGHDLRTEAVVESGRRLVATLVEALPEAGGPVPQGASIAARLWSRLASGRGDSGLIDALDAALVLLADHELAASTLAARVAASTRCGPAIVVECGLAAVSGPLHGGASFAVEELLSSIADPEQAPAAVGRHLRGGRPLVGFGHFAYPDGDPRASALLDLLGEAAGPERLAVSHAVVSAANERGVAPPNVDLALAALTSAAGMPPGSGETIFAVARCAGWLAHAIEQYERGRLIRPRAIYTGPPPLDQPPP